VERGGREAAQDPARRRFPGGCGTDYYLPKDRLGGLGEAVARARQRQLRRRQDGVSEAALQDSERRFRRLVENAPDLIFRYRPHPGSFDYVSPAASALTGYAPEDFYADPGLAFRLAHPKDRAAQAEAFRAGTAGRPATLRWIHRDGSVVWIEQRNVGVDPVGGAPSAIEGVIRDVTERKNAEEATAALLQDLRAIEAQRRGLLARLVAAQEEQSRRIAADIHDDSIQIMASAGMRLGLLARKLSDPAEGQEMRVLQDVVSQAISRLRHIMVDLRPVRPDGGGLAALLEDYLAFHREDSGVAFDLSCHLAQTPPPEIQIIVFRIAQEALTNVRKHARASQVQIRVESIDDGVSLRVNDDGVGMPAGVTDSPLGHIGLTAMRERAETAGGWFRIGNRPGGGTSVEAWVPTEPFKREP
jgi:PAS domain S-box-containing protein